VDTASRVTGFYVSREKKDRNDNDPFPGALPFVSIGNDFFAVNTTCIPEVKPKTPPFLYFQLMFRLVKF
jgi:hypothetical protein